MPRRSCPGHVVKLELEREDGRLVGEVTVLGADSTRMEVDLGATTGAVLTVERDD